MCRDPRAEPSHRHIGPSGWCLEVAIIKGMVFHLDREPFVMRIERRATRDSPGFEYAIKLKTQIRVTGSMLLDDETEGG